MDDFVLNFDTTAPTSAAGRSAKTNGSGGNNKKGGRWTDRVRDKRRNDGAVKRQSRVENGGQEVSNKAEVSDVVLGKRARDEDSTPASTSTQAAQPRLRTITASAAGSGSAPAINKSVIGPGGKKQYISSLFTAEGLPQPSGPSTPVIPARPSNAPMRSDPVATPVASTSKAMIDEDGDEEMEEQIVEDIVKPDPAPALSALGLLPEIVSHLAGKMKITGPTACQAGAIPPLIAGTEVSLEDFIATPTGQRARDAILQAQTGSGKTLAFLLPIIQDLLTLPPSIFNGQAPTRAVGTLALILAPTRELAAQIYAVLESILSLPSSSGKTTAFTVPPRALTPCLLVGGANRTHEKSRLRKGCPIVVATPGRLLDHLRTTESFRMAGEPVASKGPRGRLPAPGVPGTGSNYGALGRDRGSAGGGGRPLGLRWLVVDECDRLMDLGFEEQMKGVLEELERRSPSAGFTKEEGKRRTVLCSATASEGVDRLAGMALDNPVTLTASTKLGTTIITPAAEKTMQLSASGELIPTTSTITEIDFTPPTQLVHNYIICPPKLRFVSLIALIRRTLSTAANKQGPGSKILVFLSCTDAVDFYWEAMGSMGMGMNAAPVANDVHMSAKEKSEKLKADAAAELKRYASNSPLLPGIPIYRLHGNLELANRLGSLAAFSKKSTIKSGKDEGKDTENAVLLCTSVAARGLDVPFVSHVVQYDLPTEGGVTEYIHRVGRTARAGASGQATSFLLPTETTWIPWVEAGMKSGAEKRGVKEVKLREVGVEDVLKDGFGGVGREYETRATDVQMGFERWVSESDTNAVLARNAFASHIRAYSTHPSSEKAMFNTKSLHLGHLAKAFGMREAPGSSNAKGGKKPKSTGRVSIARPIGRNISAREAADRAIASLPARRGRDDEDGEGFSTGRRHDEDRAMKRQAEKVMRGPSGDGGGEFQIASSAMLESLAKSQNGNSSKRKR